ncbi:hypothetical protein CUMW_037820, partial [Citrus unshiu]
MNLLTSSSNHHLLQRCQVNLLFFSPARNRKHLPSKITTQIGSTLYKKPSSLPLIHKSHSLSSSQTPLYSHVNLLLNHFLSYYDTLDNVATHENLIKLLFLSWCNSLEISFLFLGNLHPYVFTNFSRRCKVRIAEDLVAFEGYSDEELKGVIEEAMKKEMDDM